MLLEPPPSGRNFTRGEETARRFGVHEIVLETRDEVRRPFDVIPAVRFMPPSAGAAVVVDAFFDGTRDDTSVWRARVYVADAGHWSWAVQSDEPMFRGRAGSFEAHESDLPGMLRLHPANPRQWADARGQWFLNISDTAYYLFKARETLWRDYAADAVRFGVTSLRVNALGGDRWGIGNRTVRQNDAERGDDYAPWRNGDYSELNLHRFQTSDSRLVWLLESYPALYVQLILFGEGPYREDFTEWLWYPIPAAHRDRTLRVMLARWAAFPQVFWQIINDAGFDAENTSNLRFAREVGRYIQTHDRWHHLLSAGGRRRGGFPFTTKEDGWASYVHIEEAEALGADVVDTYRAVPLHVFMAEDYYEQDRPNTNPVNPAYFYRWLFWSWLLSGGSANYGGRFHVVHPYSTTATLPARSIWSEETAYTTRLTGLDSVRHIRDYFASRRIELSAFQPADAVVQDGNGATGPRRPKAARRGDEEFLVYHPNAASDGRAAELAHAQTARLRVDLSAVVGRYAVEWFRAADGQNHDEGAVDGGGILDLRAPWLGQDVVVRLVKAAPPAR